MSVTANCPTSYCDEELMPYVVPDCPTNFLGGASQGIVFTCGNVPTELTAEVINGLISEGKAVKLPEIVVTLPDASPIEGQPTSGCSTPPIITSDRSIEILDYNVHIDNIDFWNDLMGRKIGAFMLYECEEDRITFVSPSGGLQVNTNRTFPAVNTEQQFFTVTLTYRGRNLDKIYDNNGIF
jgi:hypothetical protein